MEAMRRIPGVLIAAGLAAAPSAIADTDRPYNKETDDRMEMSERYESAGRSHLGLMVMGLTPELREHYGAPEDRGLLVARVEPKSPAAKAGINTGDILINVEGRSIVEVADVFEAISSAPNPRSVEVELIRDGKRMTFDVNLGKSTQSKNKPNLEAT
jgi:S1-C subfamily serine protease